MRIYDVSIPISPDMPVYAGDPPVAVTRATEPSAASPFAVSRLGLGTHTGTHVDPPAHLFPHTLTVDRLALDTLIGPATVVECPDQQAVTAAWLGSQAIAGDVRRLLFKTRNGALWDQPEFDQRFVYVAPDAAQWVIERGIRLVGIDYLSVEQYGAREPATHAALLGAGIVVVEGLDLREVPAGDYTLVCLPLKILGGDGAPARTVLLAD